MSYNHEEYAFKITQAFNCLNDAVALTYKTYAMRKKMVNYVEYNLPKLRYIERLMA